ncbi:MAG: ABC transporter substrate-binding protein, partial [Gammaproteobacteria bacterium]
MRRFIYLFLAAVNLLIAVVSVEPATRPRYGSAMRVQIRAVVRALDPADWPSHATESAAKEKLAALVFERLVRLDENGRPQPLLALSWQHDAGWKRWQFQLRPGVRFHEGSSLTPDAVVAALGATSGWRVSVAGEAVVIDSERPMPDLLWDLAHARRSIFLRSANGLVSGTGAFRIDQWAPGRRAILRANDEYWAGRPFLDTVAVEMGRTPREQLLDLELGKTDFVEILPSEVRRAEQRGAKIWSSSPTDLMALVFDRGRSAAQDRRLREAIALSIDRTAIHNVLFQKQGDVAGGLLPQWSSGYAFLFSTRRDALRARQLASALLPALYPLALVYDASDPLARAVAERIAVNVREAGITLQVSRPPVAEQPGKPDLRLVRLGMGSMQPGQALAYLAASLHLSDLLHLPNPATLEALYS